MKAYKLQKQCARLEAENKELTLKIQTANARADLAVMTRHETIEALGILAKALNIVIEKGKINDQV